MLRSRRDLQLLAMRSPKQKGLPLGAQFAWVSADVFRTPPMAAAPAPRECHHHGKSRNCVNYMALNSPWGILPKRRASAAWARTAARSAVDEYVTTREPAGSWLRVCATVAASACTSARVR